MKKVLIFITSILFINNIFSQEALKSIEEEYYDFLSLQGLVERPTLGYRTLSDSDWQLEENIQHLWQENNLGQNRILFENENQGENWFSKGFFHGLKLKIYGPEWFNSYNTAAPYGQNDGALWQGKGYNTSFTTGVRLEGYGFEATFKPQLSFSQNLEFEYLKPNYSNEEVNFKNKAGKYGYYGINSIDAPQRFGENSLYNFDWGDSEVRYNLYSFTMGFGFQSIWLGPAKINPIIHSNNAATYPKIDIGLQKQKIYFPINEIYLGEFEFRCWWGKLSESDYFDNDDTNNNNLISGLSINWALPWLFEGLTIGFNRTMLSKWNQIEPYTLFEIYIPWMRSKAGEDESDQRASIIVDYLIPSAGFEIYLEWARNDFQTTDGNFLRYPFHTQAWTAGGQKSFYISDKIQAKILFEISFLESSHDYRTTYTWASTFYAHHKITQGYTNKGQWLGAGIGTGGNSQYFSIQLIYPKGNSSIFIYRYNPDLDYVWFNSEFIDTYSNNMKTIFSIGTNTNIFLTNKIILFNQVDFIINLSNNYQRLSSQLDFSIKLAAKYNF